jgi:hypothetical protein
MTQPLTAWMQGPPLSAGVVVDDVVLVPVFASDKAGGAPFWLRVTEAGPVDGDHQTITGVRIVAHTAAAQLAEADRTIEVRLPLNQAARRVFVPVDAVRTPAVGRAQVAGQALPRRNPGGHA